MNRIFWNWADDPQTECRELFIENPIAEESWYGDEVTPEEFRSQLMSGNGPIKIHINSPGGDCVAASMIYTMLMDYPGDVTVQIDGLAASAASVIAMAGNKVSMAPTAMMMIHNPLTVVMGDARELQKNIDVLDEFKESIVNAYEIKTGLPRAQISAMMDEESWMSANKALSLGFCDEVLFSETIPFSNFSYSGSQAQNSLLAKLPEKEKPVAINAETRRKRLELMKNFMEV